MNAVDSQKYKVKTATYEGPLDLLLELIESRKLFINELSLAQIADDFIKYIQDHPEFPIDQSSEFILVASALVLIKSKSLLPGLELSEEEQASIGELEDRLAHYKLIKELSVYVRESFGKELMFAKTYTDHTVPVFVPSDEITTEALLQSMKDILGRIVETEPLPQVTVRKIISIEEMIDRLMQRVQKNISTKFSDFAGIGKQEKVHVIMSFLAMLELVKRGVIMAKQDSHGAEIELNTEQVSVPNYG